ncbi:MAG TPA: hypothetical protein VME70_07810 [Mycobacteriales bacterium]|nr:hypothetical protein [Mycobacteriales bacterium]
MPTNPGPTSDSLHAATRWQWAAVTIIGLGSVVGGIALIEWNWPLFWTAVGFMVAGVLLAWRLHIMDAVSVWSPPPEPTAPHTTTPPR